LELKTEIELGFVTSMIDCLIIYKSGVVEKADNFALDFIVCARKSLMCNHSQVFIEHRTKRQNAKKE